MSVEDAFAETRKHCLTVFNKNGHFIKHGDEIALYNLYHESGIISIKDGSGKFGNTGYVPAMSNITQNQSKFEEQLACNLKPHPHQRFAGFKILRVDGNSRKINNGDKIYLQYTHTAVPTDMFLSGNVTSESQCIYTFNPGNGFTVHINNNGIHQNVSQLLHGSEIELSSVSDIDSRVWALNIGAYKLLQSKREDAKQRWKVFVTSSSIDRILHLTDLRELNDAMRKNDLSKKVTDCYYLMQFAVGTLGASGIIDLHTAMNLLMMLILLMLYILWKLL